MSERTASRTLVKSPPELWAECSDASSLARHLGGVGEIRITKLEPETTVAWEGDEIRGTVTLEPSGWGTRVVLTAVGEVRPAEPAVPDPAVAAGPAVAVAPRATAADREPEPESEPEREPDAATAAPSGIWRRWRARLQRQRAAPVAPTSVSAAPTPVAAQLPVPVLEAPPPVAAVAPVPLATPRDARALLDRALDSLGRAHRKPYSRT